MGDSWLTQLAPGVAVLVAALYYIHRRDERDTREREKAAASATEDRDKFLCSLDKMEERHRDERASWHARFYDLVRLVNDRQVKSDAMHNLMIEDFKLLHGVVIEALSKMKGTQ